MKVVDRTEITRSKERILKDLGKLEGRKVLVVGDVGLDEYWTGDVRRISPEAPVPVVEVRSREFRVGLAANVAQNLQALGASGVLLGVVGSDVAAQDLRRLLKSEGVTDQNLLVDSERPTTHKVRVMCGQHHVVRVDFEERQFLTDELEKDVLASVQSLLEKTDGMIIQDYGKGVFSETLTQGLIAAAHKKNKKVVVDPHRSTPLHFYRGADLLKPNRDESFILSALNLDERRDEKENLLEVGRTLLERVGAERVVITSGKDGAYIFSGSKSSDEIVQVPTSPRQVFDVTGAGDTFVATYALAWLNGWSDVDAAILANAASGVVVGKIGSVPCKKSELETALSTYQI